ncbi:S8 family serine peptidase [Chondromyces crocatus]|uniref:Peptidase S8/S53 domain-containing protein n=1 Tax=Chondromyces crocatus TaxID=52 RepID=A0A0K1EGB6_CHOCO|nr:S8 family serine peptidase [Chondromyces crocatus]AKT39915.1 uncharacterized protein CMC5_040660 [Chondromyces crocatus]
MVDSGVAREFLRRHPLPLVRGASFTLEAATGHLEARVYGREEILAWQRGGAEIELNDTHGHGTAILSILHDQARPAADVELYVARMLDEHLRGSSICFVEALTWLVDDESVDLVNLSLGTANMALADRMQGLINRAVARGVTLVCAAGGVPTWPAQLEGVVAVADGALARSAGADIKIDHVRTEHAVRIYEKGRWVERPMTTSYACAAAAAQVIRGEPL